MKGAKLLLISDDFEGSELWGYALTRIEFHVTSVATAEEAITWRLENSAHLNLIDENNMGLDGVGLIEKLRPTTAVPILLMTLGDSSRALKAYQAGADDCIHKPVLPAILCAKVRAWMRHSAVIPTALLDEVEQGAIRLNPESQEVSSYGRVVSLSNLEFRLLHLLMTHPNHVFPAATLYRRVWAYTDEPDNATVRTGVYRLRRKLEPDPANPKHILSLGGEGYMFQP